MIRRHVELGLKAKRPPPELHNFPRERPSWRWWPRLARTIRKQRCPLIIGVAVQDAPPAFRQLRAQGIPSISSISLGLGFALPARFAEERTARGY